MFKKGGKIINKYKKILIYIYLILANYSLAILGRSDIDISDYEDFAINNSKYEIGKKNVIVYKKNGEVSGIIKEPIPNFDSLTDNTHWTLWNDSQIFTGANHVGDVQNLSFSKRHIRNDVELFENSRLKSRERKDKNNILDMFSENSKLAVKFQIGFDYSFGRGEKVAFEAKSNKVFDGKNVVKGNLIARAGAGTNKLALENGGSIDGTAYGNFTGGLNNISGTEHLNDPDRAFLVTLQKNPLTPLDAEALRGDSGSPIFYYDKTDNSWKIVASNSGGSTNVYDAYGKYSIYRFAKEMIEEYEQQTTTEINESNILANENALIVNGEKTIFDKYKGNLVFSGRINKVSGHTYSNDVILDKNQVFNADNTVITLNGNLNTNIARFEFKKNALIKGNGNLQTAGYIVDKDATLTMENNIGKNIIVRKIGEGTLKVKGDGNNEGHLYLGDGNTILEQTNGYAASDIKLAQQAEVTLNRDGQLKDNNIYFGLRGGILNLNGHDLSFNDIYHIDSGATIKNTSTQKSTFNFNPTGDRVFLGGFKENLDINYNSNNNWQLRGDTKITGDININKGSITIVGDNLITSNKNYVIDDQFKEVNIKANNINVNENTLNIKRASKVDANIDVANNGNINLEALGNIPTVKNYENQDYAEINKIELNGNINLKENSTLNINLEKNHNIEIKSKIKGNGNIVKFGDGTAKITSIENNENNTNVSIEGGKLYVEAENTLGDSKISLKNNSIIAINGEVNFNKVLDQIDKDSVGTISLNRNLSTIPEKYNNFNNLFIGSDSNIEIGSDNEKINENLTTLRLGGDNGTVILRGLKNDTNTNRNIIVGDGIHNSTIIIDGIDENNTNLNISTNKKTNLIFQNVKENTNIPILNLNYGTYTTNDNINLLKEDANGVLVYENDINNLNVEKDFAIGAKNGSIVNVSNLSTNKDKYKFSGEGTLNIDANNFENNKEINVDAQYKNGGIVNITSETKLSNTIKVMGNNENKNEGNITLKLNENSITGNNEITIKDGGILDLNSNSLNVSIQDESNEFGVIQNENSNKSTLNISKNTTLKPKISGNIDIINNGHTLELMNENNNFNPNTSIKINNGTLNNYHNSINENVNIILDSSNLNTKENIKSNINTKNNSTIKKEIGKSINVNKIVVENGTLTLNTKEDLNEGFNKNRNVKADNLANYKNIELKDNSNLIIKDQYFNINNLNANNTNELTLKNTKTFLAGNGSNLLSSNLKKLNLENSVLVLRDYNSSNDNTPIEVIGNNSHIVVGVDGFNDNGGGAGVVFNNPIHINKDNTLHIRSGQYWNNSSGIRLNSDISGDGKLILSKEDRAKFDIQNNFKDFTGEVNLEKRYYSYNIVYNINANNEEDRTLNYKLTGNLNADKIGDKDLIVKDISDYNATFNVKNASLILDGKKAYNTRGNIINENNTELVLKEENEGILEDINAKNIGNASLRKIGNGNLTIFETSIFKNYNKFYVDNGKITLKKDVLNEKEYKLNNNSTIELNFINENKLTSNIIGDGNIIFNPKNNQEFKVSKINNNGNLEIKKDINFDLDIEKTLNQKIIGDKKISLNNKNDLTLTGDIEEFNGTFNLQNTDLKLKTKSEFKANLEGNGTLEKYVNNNLTFNDLSKYDGNIVIEEGKLILDGDKAYNSEAVIKNKNNTELILNIPNNGEINNINATNLGNSIIRKTGNGDLNISENANLVNYNKLVLEEGNLVLKKDILDNKEYELNNNNIELNFINENKLTSNITGNGNIIFNQENDQEFKVSKINNNGNLVILKDININLDEEKTLNQKIIGDKKISLNNKNTLTLNGDITEFTGNINLQDSTLKLKTENEFKSNIEGNGTLEKYVNNNLTFNDLSKYDGNIVIEEGKLILDGDKAYNSEAVIKNKNNTELILNIPNNGEINNINATNLGNSIIRKTGNGDLTISENANLVNYNKLVLEKGNLVLKKDILDNKEYELNNNNIELNFNNDNKLTSNITGNGDIIFNPENNQEFKVSKINNNGNLVILKDININLDEEKTLNQKIIGNKSISLNHQNTLTLTGDITEFTGNINLNDGNLKLNTRNKIKATIKGNGIIQNTDNDLLILKNLDNYTGSIKTTVGKIKVIGNNNISNYILDNEDIILENDSNVDLTTKKFINNNNNKLVLINESNEFILNKNNLESIKNLELEKGNLKISEDEKISLDTLTNNGNITLTNQDLDINKFENNNGKFLINLTKEKNSTLKINNSISSIDAIININDAVSNYLNKNKITLLDSDSSLNVLNFDNLYNNSKNYKYVLEKHGNKTELFKILKSLGINILYTLDNINEDSNEILEHKFENNVNMNYSKNISEDKTYNTFDNTLYKNKLNSDKYVFNFEKSFNANKFDFSVLLSYINTKNKVVTEVSDDKPFSQQYTIQRFLPSIGLRYDNLDINFRLGTSLIDFKDNNKTSLLYLNNEFNLGHKIKANNIYLKNYIGYKYNKLLKENMTSNYDNVSSIIYNSPLKLYYGINFGFEHKYIDLNVGKIYSLDLTDINIKNGDEIIKSNINNKFNMKYNFKLTLKPIKNVNIITEIEKFIHEKNTNEDIYKLGLNIKF